MEEALLVKILQGSHTLHFYINTNLYNFINVCANLLQLCLTVCVPMDYSLPRSSVHGILQARILEWVVMPASRGSSRPRDRTRVSYGSCIGRWALQHQRHLGTYIHRIIRTYTHTHTQGGRERLIPSSSPHRHSWEVCSHGNKRVSYKLTGW